MSKVAEKQKGQKEPSVNEDGLRSAGVPKLAPPSLPAEVPSVPVGAPPPVGQVGPQQQIGPRVARVQPGVPDIPAGLKHVEPSAAPQPDAPPPPQPMGPQQITLDETMILRIELLGTKQQLAERDKQLAKIALQDASIKLQQLEAERRKLMSAISQQIGRPVQGDVRLVDREKGICVVG